MAGHAPFMSDSPDILLLVLDSQRADRLGCYGYPQPISPCLDELASRSTVFSQAISPAQWTIPAHASIFTGVYPWQHGMVSIRANLGAQHITLAQRLSKAGYHTAGFSNNPFVGTINRDLRRGFAQFKAYGGILTVRDAGPPDAYGEPKPRRTLQRVLRRFQLAAADSQKWHRFYRALIWPGHLALAGRRHLKGNTGQALTDALTLLSNRTSSDPPVFAFINLMGTHTPFFPSNEALRELGYKQYPYLEQCRINLAAYNHLGPHFQQDAKQVMRLVQHLYDAEVRAQDRHLGEFLNKLSAHRGSRPVVILITADHGEHLGEKQLFGHGFGAYHVLVHVPLIIHDHTGMFPAAATVDQFVSSRRLFHTILSIAGAATPSESNRSLLYPDAECVAISRAIPIDSAKEWIEHKRPGLLAERSMDLPHSAVYKGDHKMLAVNDESRSLYSVRIDPDEQHDIAAENPSQLAELEEAYQSQFQEEQSHLSADTDQLAEREAIQLTSRLNSLGYY